MTDNGHRRRLRVVRPDGTDPFLQFSELYAHRNEDGTVHVGPYFNRVLSLGVKLGVSRSTMRSWAEALNVHTLEGGLKDYPADVAEWTTSLAFGDYGNPDPTDVVKDNALKYDQGFNSFGDFGDSL